MLHTWQAQRLAHILAGGRTRPLVVECMRVPAEDDEETEAAAPPATSLMVVKAPGLPEVTERTLFNEVFGLLIGSAVPPWCVNQLDIAKNHLFYSALRGRNLDWQPFLAAVAELTDAELETLARPLPESWRGPEARVRQHLADIREHLSQFAVELQGSLA